MPTFQHGDVEIRYETRGQGFPLLTFAPGGMRSAVSFWAQAPFDPLAELSGSFRVIALDQRNAGESRAPVRASDGWTSYSGDHLRLLDHLGIDRCHVLGGCIGSSYCLGVMKAAPERVAAAVLQNPIGLHENRDAFYQMFDAWAEEVRKRQPDVPETDWRAFRENMYGGDFVFNVSRDFVRGCAIPMLVLAGSDLYHPAPVSQEIAELAPNAELVLEWKTEDVVADTVKRVRGFLETHTPSS